MVAELKMNQEKLKMLQAQVRIGGKGTVRRKKKVVHRTATTDDKKLQSSLKKLSGSSNLMCPLVKYLEAKRNCYVTARTSYRNTYDISLSRYQFAVAADL